MQEGETKKPLDGVQKSSELLCPDGRISISTLVRGDHRVIDFSSYVPFFLVTVNNALSSGSSKLYREKYGIGITDWRILAMLAAEPSIPATRICEQIQLDKGAVSRALKVLETTGLVLSKSCKNDNRIRNWELNDKGYELYDEVIKIAVMREESLISDIPADELETFLKVMRQMKKNLLDM